MLCYQIKSALTSGTMCGIFDLDLNRYLWGNFLLQYNRLTRALRDTKKFERLKESGSGLLAVSASRSLTVYTTDDKTTIITNCPSYLHLQVK